LTRKLHNILNIPRRNFRHYFDEFYYLSADISSDYRWKLQDSTDVSSTSVLKNDGFIVEPVLSETELEYVQQKLSLNGCPLLVFNEKLSTQEILAFQGYFSLLVQKSRLEEEGAVTEQLRADRHLGVELQRYIEPSAVDLNLEGTDVSFQLRRAGSLSYDFGGALNNGCEMTVYFVDLWEAGLRAALIANSFKPYIDSVLEHHDPRLVVNQANEFVCSGHFEGLFAGMSCLTINSDTGEFRCICAGYPPLVIISSQKLQIPDLVSRPLGFDRDQDFQVFKGRIVAGDKICILSDGLFRLVFTDIVNIEGAGASCLDRLSEFMVDDYLPEDDLLFFSFTQT
jgi:serine phosphatase RsbU (regulator of sigma subunit)